MRFNIDDYQCDRAILAVTGLVIITTLICHKLLGDVAFASCFCAILAAYTTHSCLDDRRPGESVQAQTEEKP